MINQLATGNKKMDELISNALSKEERLKRGKDAQRTSHYNLVNKYGALLENSFSVSTSTIGKYYVSKKADRTYKDGFVFASKAEMLRWDLLLKVEQVGEIEDLERQVIFELQEGFISKQKEWGDVQPMSYVADFTYTNISFRKGYEGRKCIEDSKTGVRTPEYKLKRKLMLYKYAEYAFFEV